MGRIPTEKVGDAHAYTRSKTPWLFDTYREARGETSEGVKFGWRLFHYLSGGGMKTFGRTVAQEEAEGRRTRFLVAAGVFAAIWLWFMI